MTDDSTSHYNTPLPQLQSTVVTRLSTMLVPAMMPMLALLGSTVTFAAPAIPFQNFGALVNSARIAEASAGVSTMTTSSESGVGVGAGATEIEFTQCPSMGNVSQITVEPCQGGNGTLESPCEFHFSQ